MSGRIKRARRFAMGTAGAALTMYFFDPDRGRARRAKARDQLAGMMRRKTKTLRRATTRLQSSGYGIAQRARHLTPANNHPDDSVLQDRVRSEIFKRVSGAPKGHMNITVEDGWVVLRGQVPRRDLIGEMERGVMSINGVHGVRNFLHTPDSPAPNKAASLASGA